MASPRRREYHRRLRRLLQRRDRSIHQRRHRHDTSIRVRMDDDGAGVLGNEGHAAGLRRRHRPLLQAQETGALGQDGPRLDGLPRLDGQGLGHLRRADTQFCAEGERHRHRCDRDMGQGGSRLDRLSDGHRDLRFRRQGHAARQRSDFPGRARRLSIHRRRASERSVLGYTSLEPIPKLNALQRCRHVGRKW